MFKEIKLTCTKCGKEFDTNGNVLYYMEVNGKIQPICADCRNTEVEKYSIKDAAFNNVNPLGGLSKKLCTFTLGNGNKYQNVEFCISNEKLHFVNHYMAGGAGKTLDDLPDIVNEQLYELYKKNN